MAIQEKMERDVFFDTSAIYAITPPYSKPGRNSCLLSGAVAPFGRGSLPLYAYINGKDPDHKKVKSSIELFSGTLVITNYIFDEVITLILSRLGPKAALRVGNILLNSPQVEKIRVTQNDEKEAWNLLSEQKDKGYSFTDCISFVVMRRVDINAYIATDRHFKQEGFKRA